MTPKSHFHFWSQDSQQKVESRLFIKMSYRRIISHEAREPDTSSTVTNPIVSCFLFLLGKQKPARTSSLVGGRPPTDQQVAAARRPPKHYQRPAWTWKIGSAPRPFFAFLCIGQTDFRNRLKSCHCINLECSMILH